MPSREWNDVVDYITNLNNVSHSFNIHYNLEMKYKFNAHTQRMALTTQITKWYITNHGLLEVCHIKNPQEAIDYISMQMDLQDIDFITEDERKHKRAAESAQCKKRKWKKKHTNLNQLVLQEK